MYGSKQWVDECPLECLHRGQTQFCLECFGLSLSSLITASDCLTRLHGKMRAHLLQTRTARLRNLHSLWAFKVSNNRRAVNSKGVLKIQTPQPTSAFLLQKSRDRGQLRVTMISIFIQSVFQSAPPIYWLGKYYTRRKGEGRSTVVQGTKGGSTMALPFFFDISSSVWPDSSQCMQSIDCQSSFLHPHCRKSE